MPIYRDTRLATERHPPTVENPIKRTYTAAARCAECECCLSKYRTPSETRCAPCERAYQKRLLAAARPDRFEEARRLLVEGWSYQDVGLHLGWRTRQACSSAVRAYEDRHGLPHAASDHRRAPCGTCNGDGEVGRCCERHIGPYRSKCCGDPDIYPCSDCQEPA